MVKTTELLSKGAWRGGEYPELPARGAVTTPAPPGQATRPHQAQGGRLAQVSKGVGLALYSHTVCTYVTI